MNLLPPLHLMEKWRGEGLSPQQVKAKAEAWLGQTGQAGAEPEPRPKLKQARPPRTIEKKPSPPPVGKSRRRSKEQPAPAVTPTHQDCQAAKPATTRRPKAAPAPFFPFPAPAGQGYRCDAFHLNPAYGANPDAPQFIHCREVAAYRLVIRDERRARNVKRCHSCAYDLRYLVKNGLSSLKIELDEPLRRK